MTEIASSPKSARTVSPIQGEDNSRLFMILLYHSQDYHWKEIRAKYMYLNPNMCTPYFLGNFALLTADGL